MTATRQVGVKEVRKVDRDDGRALGIEKEEQHRRCRRMVLSYPVLIDPLNAVAVRRECSSPVRNEWICLRNSCYPRRFSTHCGGHEQRVQDLVLPASIRRHRSQQKSHDFTSPLPHTAGFHIMFSLDIGGFFDDE